MKPEKFERHPATKWIEPAELSWRGNGDIDLQDFLKVRKAEVAVNHIALEHQGIGEGRVAAAPHGDGRLVFALLEHLRDRDAAVAIGIGIIADALAEMLIDQAFRRGNLSRDSAGIL